MEGASVVTNPSLLNVSTHTTKSEAHDLAAAFELDTNPQALLINERPLGDRATVMTSL